MLRNSGHVICLVAYTGNQTKLHMNLSKPRFKQSQFEFNVNVVLGINVALLFLLSFVSCFAGLSFNRRHREGDWYIYDGIPGDRRLAVSSFFSYYLILNSFIPLELPFTFEGAKLFLTYWIEHDVVMR